MTVSLSETLGLIFGDSLSIIVGVAVILVAIIGIIGGFVCIYKGSHVE